jgi:hypothetical protein
MNRNAAIAGGITEWEIMDNLNTGGLPTLPIMTILGYLCSAGNPSRVLALDFSYTAEMIAEGQVLASTYLMRRAERHSDPWIKNWFVKIEKTVNYEVGKGFIP